jgi:hypothetical protein
MPPARAVEAARPPRYGEAMRRARFAAAVGTMALLGMIAGIDGASARRLAPRPAWRGTLTLGDGRVMTLRVRLMRVLGDASAYTYLGRARCRGDGCPARRAEVTANTVASGAYVAVRFPRGARLGCDGDIGFPMSSDLSWDQFSGEVPIYCVVGTDRPQIGTGQLALACVRERGCVPAP